MKKLTELLKEKNILFEVGILMLVIITTSVAIVSYYYISNIMSAILLMILGLAILFLSKKQYGVFMNSIGLFGGVWFFTMGLSCLQLHHFQKNWEIISWIYFVLTYILFVIGYILKEFIHLKKRKEKRKFKTITKKNFLTFFIMGFSLIILVFIVEILIRKEIPLFSEKMESYMNFGVTGLHYFTVCSALVIPISLIFLNCYRKQITILEFVAVIIMDIISMAIPILIVSRQLIIITLVLSAATITILHKNWENKLIIICVIIGVLGWGILTAHRNQSDQYLKDALQIQDNSVLSPKQMQIYMYLSCNFDNFNINVNHIDHFYYGQKSAFPIFAFTGLKFFIPSVTEDNLIRITKTYNTYPIIMKPYLDFGGIGIIIYMILVGIFCRFFDDTSNEIPANIITKSIIKYSMIFSFFTNAFANPTIWFYIIIMYISHFIFFKGKKLEV